MNEQAFMLGDRVHRLAAVAATVVLCLMLAAPVAQATVAVGPNYRMGNDLTPGRGKDAVGLAVDPRNPRHIVEVNADWTVGQCEYHVSFDGGRTWRGGQLRVPVGFNSAVPCSVGHHLAAAMYAGIAYGSRGNVYATFVSPKPVPGVEGGKSLFVAVSRNGGRTFHTAQLLAAGGSLAQGPDYVLPTVGVDPARRGGPRRDRVYVAANVTLSITNQNKEPLSQDNVVMATSSNAGSSFAPAANVNTPAEDAIEQSQPVIGRHGAVYIAWRDQGRASIPGKFIPQGYVVMAKSHNHGRTWLRTQIARVQGYIYTGPTTPPFKTGGFYTCCSFPRIAADPRRNDVYVVYGQGTPSPPQTGINAHIADHFINPASAVFLVHSPNGGATWSAPTQINHLATPGQPDQTRHPWVSVAPNGRVDIVWQDRRNWYRGCTNTHVICQEARLGDTYYAYSTNRGRTFSHNIRISDRSTNNDVGFDYRFGTYWAYGPVAVSVSPDQILVGWMDSREGNFQNDSQDIYLSRVTVNARGPVPVRRIPRRSDPITLSVALSRLAYPAGPEALLAGTFVTRPATRVVIVNQNDVGGALAAGVLARANLATVLLSAPSGLTANVRGEVARLQPVGAYVVGNFSPTVLSDLAAAGVPPGQIVTLAGADAAGTARLIADAADRRTAADKAARTPAFDAAIVANANSPDAVAAATLAADRRLPILYVNRDTIPPSTASALSELAIGRTIVVGGPGVVSNAVLGSLPGAQRVGGSDAYATSRALLSVSVRHGVPDNQVFVTDGTNSMETALLGPVAARIGGLQLVARGGPSLAARIVAGSHTLRASVTQLEVVEALPRRQPRRHRHRR